MSFIYKHEVQWKFRNFPASIVPDEELWFVGGIYEDGNGGYYSGVLEWCVNSGDAEYMMNKMKNEPRFTKLYCMKWQ